jgi:hypothetical protein
VALLPRHRQILYPGARVFPVTWLIRFGIGGGLLLTAGALFGDQVARGKQTLSVTLLASVVGVVGGLITIVQGG